MAQQMTDDATKRAHDAVNDVHYSSAEVHAAIDAAVKAAEQRGYMRACKNIKDFDKHGSDDDDDNPQTLGDA